MPTPETPPPRRWAKMALICGLLYGLPMGVVFSIQSGRYWVGMPLGLIAGLVFGLVFTWLMAWFVRRQSARFRIERPDFGTAAVLLEGPANHFKGAEAVGGHLWLTDNHLHFSSHKFNIQNHEWAAGVAEIATARTVKTLGMINNGLAVRLVTGEEQRFVVNHNADWVAAIDRARQARQKGA